MPSAQVFLKVASGDVVPRSAPEVSDYVVYVFIKGFSGFQGLGFRVSDLGFRVSDLGI